VSTNSARIYGLWRLWTSVDRRFRHLSGSEPCRIGRLDLLRLLYQQVLIPAAVHGELLAAMRSPSTPIDFASIPWLTAARPSELPFIEKSWTNSESLESEVRCCASQPQTPFGLFVGNALAGVELGKSGLDSRQKD